MWLNRITQTNSIELKPRIPESKYWNILHAARRKSTYLDCSRRSWLKCQ